MARADHGDPAVGAEPRRVVVAIDQARLLAAGNHPLRTHIPQFQLFLHALLDRVTGHDAADHPAGRRQIAPVAIGQFFNVLQELGAVRQQTGTHAGGVVQRPFQTGVPNIQGQKSHARIMTKPTLQTCGSAARAGNETAPTRQAWAQGTAGPGFPARQGRPWRG
ncbi:hypothetical protein D9M68_873610 [compost metagenome]